MRIDFLQMLLESNCSIFHRTVFLSIMLTAGLVERLECNMPHYSTFYWPEQLFLLWVVIPYFFD